MTDWPLILVILAVGAACFYAGWRSAASYLTAAEAVAQQAGHSVRQANAHVATSEGYKHQLEQSQEAMVALRDEVARNTEAHNSRYVAVEVTLRELFRGLELAGAVRTTPPRTGRQHGDPKEPD